MNKAKECFDQILRRREEKLEKLSKLKNHALNPLLDTHKAVYLFGDDSEESLAKALIYPSIIGTGLNTSFGSAIQTDFLTSFDNVDASATKGLDIEFEHAIKKERIYCQLKASVNTINYDDVDPIINKFTKAIRLIRDNGGADIPQSRFIVGIFSGRYEDRNGNYKKIESSSNHQVVVGKDFWEAVTGDSSFYNDLASTFREHQRKKSNAVEKVNIAVRQLADELKKARK